MRKPRWIRIVLMSDGRYRKHYVEDFDGVQRFASMTRSYDLLSLDKDNAVMVYIEESAKPVELFDEVHE